MDSSDFNKQVSSSRLIAYVPIAMGGNANAYVFYMADMLVRQTISNMGKRKDDVQEMQMANKAKAGYRHTILGE